MWGDQEDYTFLQFFTNLSLIQGYEPSVGPKKKGHFTRHINLPLFSEGQVGNLKRLDGTLIYCTD